MSAYTDILAATRDKIASLKWNKMLRQTVIQCFDSSEYPTDPSKGMLCYDQTLGYIVEYQTATAGWTKMWVLPWGRTGEGVDATAYLTTAGPVTVVALHDAFESVANRLMKISFRVCFTGHAATPGDGAFPLFQVYKIKDGGSPSPLGTGWQWDAIQEEVRIQVTDWTTDTIVDPGLYEYTLIATATAGSNIDIRSDLAVAQLLVEDIGPGIAPSDVPQP